MQTGRYIRGFYMVMCVRTRFIYVYIPKVYDYKYGVYIVVMVYFTFLYIYDAMVYTPWYVIHGDMVYTQWYIPFIHRSIFSIHRVYIIQPVYTVCTSCIHHWTVWLQATTAVSRLAVQPAPLPNNHARLSG
jgi:hypothetical protein